MYRKVGLSFINFRLDNWLGQLRHANCLASDHSIMILGESRFVDIPVTLAAPLLSKQSAGFQGTSNMFFGISIFIRNFTYRKIAFLAKLFRNRKRVVVLSIILHS